MDRKSWTVVKFLDENTVEAIPTSWIIGNECYWPSYVLDKVRTAIKNYEQPNTCWQRHKISLFRNATFETYHEALTKSAIAEYNSDLTDVDESRENRKIRKKKTAASSSEDDHSEDNLNISQLPRRNIPVTVVKAHQRKQNVQQSQSSISLENADIIIEEVFTGEPVRNNFLEPRSERDFAECKCCSVHQIDIHKMIENMANIMENLKSLTKKSNLLVSMVSDNSEQLKKISNEVENLKLRTSVNTDIPDYESFLTKFEFPLSTKEQLIDFNEYLKNEIDFKAAVVELSKIGGNNQYDYVRRVLSLLMKDCLAMQYTWLGTKEKSSFSTTKIAEVLLRGLQNTELFIDMKNSEESIKKYLRRARERNAHGNK